VKRHAILFSLSILLSLFTQWLPPTASAISNEPERMRIAIADFETMGGDLGFKDVGSIVAEWLITSFVQSGRYEVVERSLSYRRSWKSRSWLFPAWWRRRAR